MKKKICVILTVLLAFSAIFAGTVFAEPAPADLGLTFTHCDPPDEDLYTAQEDTTVLLSSPQAAGGETITYTLTFSLDTKDSRTTEAIPYTGEFLLTDAISQALDDAVITQDELDATSVIFIAVTAGDADAPTAEAFATIIPAGCQPVTFTLTSTTQIVLSCATADAEIRYTTDGISPNVSAYQVYTAPITLTEDTAFYASAWKKGLRRSEMTSAAYPLPKSGIISANPAPGTVAAGTQVTLSAAEGESILYTTDGTTPVFGAANTTVAGNAAVIPVQEDTLICARTQKNGVSLGSVQRFSYTVSAPDAYEPNDTRSAAPALSFPAKIKATIHSASDVDCYRFSYDYAAPAELLLFQPEQTGINYTLCLYDSSGQKIAQSALAGDQRIRTALEAGDYYAVVQSEDGSFSSLEYTLCISKQAAAGLDLSEYNMLNAMLNADSSQNCYTPTTGRGGILSGGNIYMALAYLARWDGPVLESSDPYMLDFFEGDISEFTYNPQSAQYHLRQAILLPDREKNAEDTLHYKNAIYTYGAIYCGIRHMDEYYDATESYYFKPQEDMTGGGHAISLVGWDNSIPKENFTVTVDGVSYTPAGDGAFLAKNNYGTQKGQNGYFWISYYSADLSSNPAAAIFVTDPQDSYDNIYQYDPLGYTNFYQQSQYMRGPVLYTKNTFTAAGDQTLRAVSFYALHEDQDYDIFLEAGGTTRHVASGTHKYKGYYTADLGDIPLAEGEDFSVIVRLQNRDGSDLTAAVEMPIRGWSERAGAQTGQSFTSTDGVNWTDISDLYTANNCIKAFTDGAGGGTADNAGRSDAMSEQQLAATNLFSPAAATVDTSSDSGESRTRSLPSGETAQPVTDLPASFDLRDIGGVTEPKDQGIIPSCWTFAAMSSAESILLRQNNIAEQQGILNVSLSCPQTLLLDGTGSTPLRAAAAVHTENGISSGVYWRFSGDLDSIDIQVQQSASGEEVLLFTANAPGSITVTAYSDTDDTKRASRTVTITRALPTPSVQPTQQPQQTAASDTQTPHTGDAGMPAWCWCIAAAGAVLLMMGIRRFAVSTKE